MKVPLARPYFSDEEANAVKEVLNSGWVAQGPKCKEFEDKFAQYIGTKHALSVNSATSALHCALEAAGVGKGDRILIPDYTFPASGNVAHFVGAEPVLVDIDKETFNIDSGKIEDSINENTKAIMPVHIFGNPADMDTVMRIAKDHNLTVIEDAACAHGAEINGKKVGGIGDISCFSFHARKILSTGEGGMITTNGGEFKTKVESFRSHGMSIDAWKREDGFKLPSFDSVGYNYRMSDITAAIGIAQLGRVQDFIGKRIKLAKYYDDLISDKKLDVRPQQEQKNGKHVYQTYSVLLGKQGIRDKVINAMQSNGVGCTIGTYSLSKLKLFEGNCPNGNFVFENSIALPMFHELKEEEIEYVVKTLDDVLKSV